MSQKISPIRSPTSENSSIKVYAPTGRIYLSKIRKFINVNFYISLEKREKLQYLCNSMTDVHKIRQVEAERVAEVQGVKILGGSGVARNFRQGVRQCVAFLSVHSRSDALRSRPYNQKTSWHYQTAWVTERTKLGFTRRPITLRNHIPKITYFPDRGCVLPSCHLYGHATVTRG